MNLPLLLSRNEWKSFDTFSLAVEKSSNIQYYHGELFGEDFVIMPQNKINIPKADEGGCSS